MYNPFYYWDFEHDKVVDNLEQNDFSKKIFIYALDYCPTEVASISSI